MHHSQASAQTPLTGIGTVHTVTANSTLPPMSFGMPALIVAIIIHPHHYLMKQ
jgi:hypothetical protein